MYLFDTDIITNIFKKKPSEYLCDKLKNIRKEHQFISTITLSEVSYGAYKSEQTSFHIDNLTRILLPSVTILDFDTNVSYICGRLRADMSSKGLILSWLNLQISSIEISNDLTLIAGNVKYFDRINDLNSGNWILN